MNLGECVESRLSISWRGKYLDFLSNVTYAIVSLMAPISSLPPFMVCGDVDRCVTMSNLGECVNIRVFARKWAGTDGLVSESIGQMMTTSLTRLVLAACPKMGWNRKNRNRYSGFVLCWQYGQYFGGIATRHDGFSVSLPYGMSILTGLVILRLTISGENVSLRSNG
nr:hypothetical protein [Tanacetum cinerariifolium]